MTDTEAAPFCHVCFAVPDLIAAMADLTRATGCHWRAPWDGSRGDSSFTTTFTTTGPPYIELVTAIDGPWAATTGARFDHVGYWTTSIASASHRLSGHGFAEGFSGCSIGRPFIGHRPDSIGARIEMFDRASQP